MFARRLLKTILYNRKINPTARALLKPVSPLIPKKFVPMLPVLSRFSVGLPGGRYLVLEEREGQDAIARILYWKGFRGFEYETARLFYELAKESSVVFDIGANIGYYSLLAAIANSEAQIYAFEPVPRVYDRFLRNVELNNASNVTMVRAAVTSFDGDITIYVPIVDVPSSASTLEGFREHTEEMRVPAITIDTFADQNQISRVDLMKIDTEGTECNVLEKARHIVERDEPIIICEVLKGMTEEALQSFFRSSGYEYYWITDTGLVQKDIIEGDYTHSYMNYLFCKKERVASIERIVG